MSSLSLSASATSSWPLSFTSLIFVVNDDDSGNGGDDDSGDDDSGDDDSGGDGDDDYGDDNSGDDGDDDIDDSDDSDDNEMIENKRKPLIERIVREYQAFYEFVRKVKRDCVHSTKQEESYRALSFFQIDLHYRNRLAYFVY